MSPKARLTLSVTALSAAVAILLSALSLSWLAAARFRGVSETARLAAESVKTYLLQRVEERAELPPGATIADARVAWQQAAASDPAIERFLLSIIAASPDLVEILVTDEEGGLIVSSDPGRSDDPAAAPDLDQWTSLPPWEQFRQVIGPARDLEMRRSLAAGDETIFNIRILVSTTLVRSAVLPQLRTLALAAGLCILCAALLAAVLANVAARPLERVSRFIDAINEGRTGPDLPPPPDRELAAIESKLALLGERVRGARDATERGGSVAQILSRLQSAVLLFDSDSELVMASQATERFLRAPRWELIGRPLEDVFRANDPLGSLVQTSVNLRRTFYDQPIEWQAADGAAFALVVSVETLTDFPERRFLGAVVTLQDAASRRQLESQIDSSYRREAFGRLLQGVAHEIKNPLNSVHTQLQLLEVELGGQAPAAAETLTAIRREVKTLDRMVVTLLDFTKPLELELTEVDLGELAREVAGLVRPKAGEKSIELLVADEASPAVIQADRGLLRQAVLNVAGNAVECMDAPGTVRLTTVRNDDAVTLSIADQGPGVPEEIRDKIFNLYFTTKGKRGSGIGLAMAYRVAQFHGGSLEFTTSTEGTTFEFRFPSS